jgi:hypothetical protein
MASKSSSCSLVSLFHSSAFSAALSPRVGRGCGEGSPHRHSLPAQSSPPLALPAKGTTSTSILTRGTCEVKAEDEAGYRTHEVDADVTVPNLRFALASLLLNVDGWVRPYLVYRYDSRRCAALERRFIASSSSLSAPQKLPARPIWRPLRSIEWLSDIPATRAWQIYPFTAREGRRRQIWTMQEGKDG